MYRWILIVSVGAPLIAQTASTTAALQGVIVDSSGLPVIGASVTLRSNSLGSARTTTSNGEGQWLLTNLRPGAYLLDVQKAGFAPVLTNEFTLSLGELLRQRLILQPATVRQQLEVNEQPEALQAAAPTAAVSLGGERIEGSPAPARNYLNFVLSAPGAAPASGSNTRRSAASTRSPLSDSGFSFAGMRPRNNSLSIDGVDNRDETSGGSRVAVGLEMVAEFRVSGTTVSPDFGNGAGGAVNVITRSGTNLWHGDFTYFAQNELFNARSPEIESAAKPRSRRQQPGTSLNGPLRPDRTFFSYAFEQTFESGEEWSDAPDAFLSAINGKLGRETVQRGLFRTGERETEFSLKMDHQISSRHALTARYAFSRGRVRNDVQDADNFTDRSARGSSRTVDHSLVAGWTFVASAHTIFEMRGQVAGREQGLTPNSGGPMIEIPGVLTFGQAYRLNASRRESHGEWIGSLTRVVGRHQVVMGGSLHGVNLEADIANRFGGILLYPTIDAFFADRPAIRIQAFGDPHTHIPIVAMGAWFADRYQPVTGLTLEYGFRYDRESLPDRLPESNKNLAPRLGIAWQPGGRSKTVYRAGFGLFYDRTPLAFLNDAIQKDGLHAREYFNGALSAYRADDTLPSTYSRKVVVGAERAINKDTTVTAEYSWVRGYHLPRTRNAALTLPAIFQLEQNSNSSYSGASFSINRRLNKEVAFLVSASTGRTYDDASDFDEQPQNPGNWRAEWARSRQHQAFRLSANALFEAFEGVTLAPIVSYGSGRPLNRLATDDLFHTGAWPISARPNGSPRNAYLSPLQLSLDLRVMKTFPFHENRSRFQIGVESFNLTNHTNPLRFNLYGTASYGAIVETLNARQLQVVAQFEF